MGSRSLYGRHISGCKKSKAPTIGIAYKAIITQPHNPNQGPLEPKLVGLLVQVKLYRNCIFSGRLLDEGCWVHFGMNVRLKRGNILLLQYNRDPDMMDDRWKLAMKVWYISFDLKVSAEKDYALALISNLKWQIARE